MWNYQQFGTDVQLRLFSHPYETLPSHETNRIGMAHLVDWIGKRLLQLRTALVNAREFQSNEETLPLPELLYHYFLTHQSVLGNVELQSLLAIHFTDSVSIKLCFISKEAKWSTGANPTLTNVITTIDFRVTDEGAIIVTTSDLDAKRAISSEFNHRLADIGQLLDGVAQDIEMSVNDHGCTQARMLELLERNKNRSIITGLVNHQSIKTPDELVELYVAMIEKDFGYILQ